MHNLSSINYKKYFSDDFYHLYLIFILAFSVRLIFVLFTLPKGVTQIYLLVASNIVNGCGVAISPVSAETCVPHFGGNQVWVTILYCIELWLFDNSN